MISNLMTKKEVVRYLNMSESSVYRLAKSKIIPEPFAISANRIVWDRGELEQYIEKKKENRGFLK